ncbi:MAG: universal stress protein [Desulfobacteraceae bacterium]
MVKNIQKMIVVPVDGSEFALKPLEYINLVFGPQHDLKTTLFYVLPKLPPFLLEESSKDRKMMKKLQDVESRNTEMAQRFLKAARDKLVNIGFTAEAVEAVFRKIEVGIARDIVHWSEKKQADAVFISTRGRSRLEAFFMGEIAAKVLEYSRVCPVWMVKGSVKKKQVLLAIDNSKNALRAADHAGFMLSGTDVKVTIFHSKRDLRRFIPKAVIDEFPEVQKYWRHRAGEEIVPFMQKAKDKLLAAGLGEEQITSKVIDGNRSAAADILDEAQNNDTGTIILGLRGYSGVKDFTMGSVTRKVLNQARDMTVSIVP